MVLRVGSYMRDLARDEAVIVGAHALRAAWHKIARDKSYPTRPLSSEEAIEWGKWELRREGWGTDSTERRLK